MPITSKNSGKMCLVQNKLVNFGCSTREEAITNGLGLEGPQWCSLKLMMHLQNALLIHMIFNALTRVSVALMSIHGTTAIALAPTRVA